MNDKDKKVIRESWQLVVPIAETAADLFYRKLFELKPEYRNLFSNDIGPQKRKLVAMLAFIVQALDYPESAWRESVGEENDLLLLLLALGRRHTDLYRIPNEAYDAVGAALIWTLDYGLGKAFTPEVKDAWLKVYRLVSTTMKMGRLSVPEPPVVTTGLNALFGSDKSAAEGAQVRR